MTNSTPPPFYIPVEFVSNKETSDYFFQLNNAVYEMWYTLGGQQDGIIFSDRVSLDGKTSDDLPEGSTNLYYTEARFDSSFALKTTDDLAEGSTNLYYTQTRQDDAESFAYFMGA